MTKAEVTDKGLYIEASIYDTADTDDVWSDISEGKLNKFSVFGKRISASPECKITPESRKSPCVTKALHLYSISVVGDNAINEHSFLEVVDAFEKAENTSSPMMHTVTDGREPMEEITEKAEETLHAHEGNTSSILERLSRVEDALQSLVESDKKVHDSMEKSEEESDMEEKEEVEKCNKGVEKAEVTIPVDETAIIKAKLTEYETIIKAYDEKFSKIEERISTIESEVKKAHEVVVIPGELKSDSVLSGQLDAIYRRT